MKKFIIVCLMGVIFFLTAMTVYFESIGFPVVSITWSMSRALVKEFLGQEVTCADFPPAVRRGMPSCLL